MGVALLGGFGDLNVDRSTRDGDPSQKTGDGATATSTALALQPGELMKLRVPELKKKLVSAGVDLAKFPAAVEKKVGNFLNVFCHVYDAWTLSSVCLMYVCVVVFFVMRVSE